MILSKILIPSIRLFADDTSLYIIVDDAIQAAETLNSDLEKISRWAQQWLVTFNPAKSESILFSRKLKRLQLAQSYWTY